MKPNIHNTSSFSDVSSNSTKLEHEERVPNNGHSLFTVDPHKVFRALLQQSSPTTSAQV